LHNSVSTIPSSAGGASAERADFQDFTIRKLLDKASPKLAEACAAGTHIDTIIIELCRAGTDKVTFMTYTLKNCLIRRVNTTSGSDVGNNFPAETVKINYGKIQWRYTVQKRQGGGPAGNVACGWDRQKNCKM
jgi:type VI secretion system secreted protein Hcp